MDLEALVRAGGKRMTYQRRLVLDAIARTRHHTTADEISKRVRAKDPDIDSSTVYRNLEALEELGVVTHTHVNDRVIRWHRADLPRHGHLICRSCGTEQELPLASMTRMSEKLRAEHGFRPDFEHSAIVGICRDCSDVP